MPDRESLPDLEVQFGVGFAQGMLGDGWAFCFCKNKTQIRRTFWPGENFVVQASRDLYIRDVQDLFGFVCTGDFFEDAAGGNRNHHDAGSGQFAVPLGDVFADRVAED